MLLLQKAKIPAVIAAKSKEELQTHVLDLLKKLKVKDKKIEGGEMHFWVWQGVCSKT